MLNWTKRTRRDRQIRPGAIVLSQEETAILVHYELEGQLYADDGVTIVTEKSQATKKIKVKAINEHTNVPSLAGEIVTKCKLIHHSKTTQVEDLLYQLQQRETGGGGQGGDWHGGRGGHDAGMEAEMEALRVQEEERVAAMEAEAAAAAAVAAAAAAAAPADRGGYPEYSEAPPLHIPQVTAYVEELDDYIEKLYDDDMAVKVEATTYIAALARSTETLESLLAHETVVQTLARVLREDGRKSVDLATNIIGVFFSFSNFSQFHQVILENQMGDMTMRIIDLEVKRSEDRIAALKGKRPDELTQRRIDLASRRQDRLFYVCFYLLLNLSEDPNVERKMKKRNIVVYLVKMLERRSVDLLVLCVTFLKKLSIYRENKDKMLECNIIDKLARFVPGQDVLLLVTLRLLLNLSFDPTLRQQMVDRSMIPRVVELMKNPHFQHVSMALLYHISMDDKCKSMFTYTAAVPIILDFLLQVEDLHSAPELIALAVNLTQNQRNTEVLCETIAGPEQSKGFDLLVQRALRFQDPLAFKVIRNLSQQDVNIKLKFRPYVQDLVYLLKLEEAGSDLMVEVLGTLGNLNIPQFDMTELCREHGLLDYMAALLNPGVVEDDVALEAIIFTGALVNNANAHMIVDAGLVDRIYNLMSEKKEDDEFVLQIAYAFQRMLCCEATREALLSSTQVVFYLVDLLQDKNKEVRKTADMALDVIMDKDEDWAVKIRRMKFENHNQEWLELVEQDYGGGQEQDYGGGAYPGMYESDGEDVVDGQEMHSPGFSHLVLDAPQDYWGDDYGDEGGFEHGADVDYNEY